MNLFYAPNIEGKYYTLNKEESKHIIKVLRKTEGEIIHFTNGNGLFFETQIISAIPSACEVEILKSYEGNDKRNYKLHIAIAPTKNNDRTEWFLEKSTEIGIDEITPIICEQSERKVVKHDRFEKVITAAVKQSLKSFHPQLNEQQKLKDFLTIDFKGQKFIAYIDEDVTLELPYIYKKGEDVLILIGPEGDFRPEEVELAKQKGFIPISLGNFRLRTETAAVVACNTISILNSI
ncbi:MAG: 16S rRNA (uracil(1498)-N(3))-methyltransferase [Marinilabiliales bacterium]|nr:MAG: 16S rRNA (uracil(1498)-N(3))-methyltransferase [Marinilabiliales bacterium]